MTLKKFASCCKICVELDIWLVLDSKTGVKMHLTDGVRLFADDVAKCATKFTRMYGNYDVKSVDDVKGNVIRITIC